MITPFLFVKQRLVELHEETDQAKVWLGIREILRMLDYAIYQQEAEDRARQEQVEALIQGR